MNALRLAKHRFSLRFTADAVLPGFIGNTVRGALGAALDDLGSPAYERMFKINSAESIPNPYTISVPYPSKVCYKKDDALAFEITLFGLACEFGDDVTAAARDMCKGKLENCVTDGHELIYDREWSDAGAESMPYCGELTVHFLTPTEIHSGKEPLMEIDFNTFIDSLFGRISDIIGNYTDGELVIPYSLVARRPFVQAEYNLKSVEFKTSGQPIRAVTGRIKYSGDVTRYLPYIDLGSQTHIGKKTTRACGEYSFEIREGASSR
jgi:hypothetical protein